MQISQRAAEFCSMKYFTSFFTFCKLCLGSRTKLIPSDIADRFARYKLAKRMCCNCNFNGCPKWGPLKDKRTNAATGHRPGETSPPCLRLCAPPCAPSCRRVAAKIKAKLLQKRNEIKANARHRTQNPQSGQSGQSAIRASVAIVVSAMIAKSNSPKRCGTKRGNIFYA